MSASKMDPSEQNIDFSSPIITYEEPWIRNYNPESKQQSYALKHKRSTPPKKFCSVPHLGNKRRIVFLSNGITFQKRYFVSELSMVSIIQRQQELLCGKQFEEGYRVLDIAVAFTSIKYMTIYGTKCLCNR
jgi:hypothetical protein